MTDESRRKFHNIFNLLRNIFPHSINNADYQIPAIMLMHYDNSRDSEMSCERQEIGEKS